MFFQASKKNSIFVLSFTAFEKCVLPFKTCKILYVHYCFLCGLQHKCFNATNILEMLLYFCQTLKVHYYLVWLLISIQYIVLLPSIETILLTYHKKRIIICMFILFYWCLRIRNLNLNFFRILEVYTCVFLTQYTGPYMQRFYQCRWNTKKDGDTLKKNVIMRKMPGFLFLQLTFYLKLACQAYFRFR